MLLVGAAYFYAVSPPYFYGVPLEYMNNTTNQLSLFEYMANNPQTHQKGLFNIGESGIYAGIKYGIKVTFNWIYPK